MLILYADDIVLMVMCPYDLENQLRILKDFCTNMGMTVNTNKTKVMIIKSNKGTYENFIYDNNNLEEVTSYKYLGINFHHKLNWNYSIEKRINGGWKAYFGLENSCKSTNLVMWEKKNSSLKHSSPQLFYMAMKFEVVAFLESWRIIKKI